MNLKQIIRWLQGESPGMSAGVEYSTRKQREASLLAPSIFIQLLVRLADVSFYQVAVDFVKMKAAGIKGVFIRAGQRNWIDIKFVLFWSLAKLAGLPRGTYFLYDSRETPEKQAALWWSLIKNDTGELPHAADLEENYGGAYGTKAHFKKFIQEFQSLSGLPNDKIVIYTAFYWWKDHVGNDPFFKAYKLWLAWYATMAVVKVPLPWVENDLIFWQDTSHGDGGIYGVDSGNIDLDWFHADLDTFNKLAGVTLPPPIGEPMYYGKVKEGTTALTIRDGPGVSYSETGKFLTQNDLVEAVEILGGWWNLSRINGVPVTQTSWASGAYIQQIAAPSPIDPHILSVHITVEAIYQYSDGTSETYRIENVEAGKVP